MPNRWIWLSLPGKMHWPASLLLFSIITAGCACYGALSWIANQSSSFRQFSLMELGPTRKRPPRAGQCWATSYYGFLRYKAVGVIVRRRECDKRWLRAAAVTDCTRERMNAEQYREALMIDLPLDEGLNADGIGNASLRDEIPAHSHRASQMDNDYSPHNLKIPEYWEDKPHLKESTQELYSPSISIATSNSNNTAERKKDERMYFIDWCRLAAVFYVMIGHNYKIALWNPGDADNNTFEEGHTIFHAVAIGYHWCIPMLMLISGMALNIALDIHLRKCRSVADSIGSRQSGAPSHFNYLLMSTWRLVWPLAVGLLINTFRIFLSPIEWGGPHAPHPSQGESESAYLGRYLSWIFDLSLEKGGFWRAGYFGIIGNQWYLIMLIALTIVSFPFFHWVKNTQARSLDQSFYWNLFVLACFAPLCTYLEVTRMNVAYVIGCIFVPMGLIILIKRIDSHHRLGLLAFCLTSLFLAVSPRPRPKELFYLQFFVFFLVGFYLAEFRDKLLDPSKGFILRDFRYLPLFLFIFWNYMAWVCDALISSINGPYPIHRSQWQRLGAMIGTWTILLFMISASLHWINEPVIPFLYWRLKRFGLMLYTLHTTFITIMWTHVGEPYGLGIYGRFWAGFFGCVALTFATFFASVWVEELFSKRRNEKATNTKQNN